MAEHSEKKIQTNIITILREQGIYRKIGHVAIMLSVILVLVVAWVLHMNAITLNSTELICETAEHTHTDSCYSWVAASGKIYTVSTTSAQSSMEAVESTEGTEGIEATECIEATEVTESIDATEMIEATEYVGLTETAEATEDTGATEDTESTEASSQYVLTSDPEPGDTIIVDGVEYTYTLTCTQEEHTHTDTCYSTADETEGESDDNTVLLYSYVTNTEVVNENVETADESGETGSSEETVSNSEETISSSEGTSGSSDDASEEEVVSSKSGTLLSGSNEEDDSQSSTQEEDTGTQETQSTEASGTLTVEDTETGESVTYQVADCTYDSDTGDFSVEVSLNFTFLKDNRSSSNYKADYDTTIVTTDGYTVAYEITLPDGILVPSDLMDIAWNGYDQAGSKQFEYYFVENTDQSGNVTYSVVLVFAESFIDSLSGDTFDGELSFSGYASQSAYDTGSGEIELTYGMSEELTLTISKGDITWGGSESVLKDITVTKSGKYNSSDNTITYTITVYTEKGTGDTITLTDYFSDDNFSDILGDLVSITYQSAATQVRTWTSNSDGSQYTWNDGTTTSGESSNLTAYTDGSSVPYYYYDSDGQLIIVLEGLEEADTTTSDDNGGTTVTKQLNSWVITYTYEVNPESNVVYYSGNKVIAETDDTVAETDISDKGSASVTVSGSTMIAKSGSYDKDSATITWTIVVGDGSADLSGYVLTDDMLAKMESGSLVITDSSGSTPAILYATRVTETKTGEDGNDYECYTYTYYSNADCTTDVTADVSVDDTTGLPTETDTWPLVILYDDAAGQEVQGIICNGGTQYTITYKTELDDAWTSQYVTNDAQITYEGTNADLTGSGYESVGSVWITGQGQSAFSKSSSGATVDANDDSLYTAAWAIEITVPSAGVPEGTTFTDYVSGSVSGSHYITSAQASDIITALEEAWGAGNITDIQFCTSANYWYNSESDWVDADEIDSTSDIVYYQFHFTTVYEVEYYDSTEMNDLTDEERTSLANNGYFTRVDSETSETKVYYGDNAISYSYSTTSKVNDGDDTNTYYNYFTDSSSTVSSSWTWYKNVVKYGVTASGYASGSGSNSVTLTDEDDYNVSWIVRVAVDSNETYTITDTLPAGVTISELYVSSSGSDSGYNKVAVGSTSGTAESTTLSGIGTFSCTVTQDTGNTEEDLSDDVYTVKLTVSGLSSGVSLLYIKYVCSAENAAVSSTEETNDYTKTTYDDLTNSVEVTTSSGDKYGSSEETTTLIRKIYEEDSQELIKEAEFDTNNNVLNYSVLINKEGTAYTYENSEGEEEKYDSLTVTDVLSYYSYPMYGEVRSATLITSSVKLYYATVDDNGNVTKGSAVSTSDYTWTLSEDVTATSWQEFITKTMELTVPNGETLLLEYQYLVTIVISDDCTNPNYCANVSNSATLSAEGTEIYSANPTQSTEKVDDSKTSASVSGNSGYTIYKVDEDNFSITLGGAVFTLYVYNGSKFSSLGTLTTSSSGVLTVSGTLVEDANGDPSYYTVTMSDGTTATIPVDTMCYLRETTAPEDYKIDGVNYYFYFGSSISTTASDCNGYNSETMGNAKNVIVSYTNYITNAHSSDYYADKTTISVTKTWFDADGESYTKTDGSLTFDLYRVLILNDGTITSAAEQEGTSTDVEDVEDTEDNSGKATLTWTILDTCGVSSTGSLSVEASAEEPVTVQLSFYSAGLTSYAGWGWYPTVKLYEGSDSSGTLLATFSETSSTDTFKSYDTEVVTGGSIDYTNCTYSFTVVVTEDMELYCNTGDRTSTYASLSEVSSSASVVGEDTKTEDTETEDTETGSSETGSSETGSTEETASSSGTIYSATFSTLYPSDTKEYYYNDTTGKYTNDYYLDGVSMGTVEGSSENTGFFTVYGNLNTTHDSIAWDVDQDGVVETDEVLDVCLKMESDVNSSGNATWIQFTSEKGGYLRLAFNSENDPSGVAITDSEGNTTNYYASANTIYVYLDPGTYTISRNCYCFLFYIEFAEGATESNDVTDTYYIHNFNNGTASPSGFYTLSGELSHSYGSISYKGVSASQCLKMGSKASISFTTEESGTLYLIMTNPKGSKKVGIVLDGTEVLATETSYTNSAGYTIYEITTRITAGSHTITRITGTENMLYYIEYTPDDYGGKTWEDDSEDQALGALLKSKGQTTYDEYWANKELVGSYTVTATQDWSWSSSQLASEYVDTETGETLGYFVYFVVEQAIYDTHGEPDEEGNYPLAFATTYLNDSGITGGSIGIANQINEEVSGATSIAVKKEWTTDVESVSSEYSSEVESELEAAIASAEISYDVYAQMEIEDTEAAVTAGDSEVCTFSLATGNNSFFTVSGSNPGTASYGGSVTYNGVTYSSALKMDGSGVIDFEAPATNGTLTLVFSTYTRSGSTGTEGQYGPDFSITGSDGVRYSYVYTYDSDSKTGKFTVYKNGTETDDEPYSVNMVTYSQDDNIAVVTLTLGSEGDYTVRRSQTISSQCTLYYMEYSYYYSNLVDGYVMTSGTLTASSTYTYETTDASSGETTSTTVNWAKLYQGLPYRVFDDTGTKLIGSYTYYIKETGIRITINGVVYELEPDEDGYYTLSFTDENNTGIVYKYKISSGISLVNSDDPSTVVTSIVSSGTATITNAVTATRTYTGAILPATGGISRDEFYAIVAMLMGLCATLLLTHLHQESMRKRKSRQG